MQGNILPNARPLKDGAGEELIPLAKAGDNLVLTSSRLMRQAPGRERALTGRDVQGVQGSDDGDRTGVNAAFHKDPPGKSRAQRGRRNRKHRRDAQACADLSGTHPRGQRRLEEGSDSCKFTGVGGQGDLAGVDEARFDESRAHVAVQGRHQRWHRTRPTHAAYSRIQGRETAGKVPLSAPQAQRQGLGGVERLWVEVAAFSHGQFAEVIDADARAF